MIKTNKKVEVKPIDQWQALNKITTTYKYFAIAGLLSSVFLGILLVIIPFKDPTVVLTDGKNKEFFKGRQTRVELGEEDVAEVVKDYVRARYQWEKLDPNAVFRRVSPLVTEGLAKKIKSKLVHVASKEIGDKKVSQFVTDKIFVTVTKEKVLAKFFAVLEIEGKPVATPSELSFNLIQGPVTNWNPRGLYINGIIKHSEAL